MPQNWPLGKDSGGVTVNKTINIANIGQSGALLLCSLQKRVEEGFANWLNIFVHNGLIHRGDTFIFDLLVMAQVLTFGNSKFCFTECYTLGMYALFLANLGISCTINNAQQKEEHAVCEWNMPWEREQFLPYAAEPSDWWRSCIITTTVFCDETDLNSLNQ